MRKFKLAKSYPGSPELGVEVERHTESASQFYRTEDKTISIFKSHVEDNPEYWEEIIENKFMVSTRNSAFLNAYSVAKVNPNYKCNEYEVLFNSREHAKEFILYNKPCLSYWDLMWNFVEDTKNNRLNVNIDELVELIKTK
jgi:lipocalin